MTNNGNGTAIYCNCCEGGNHQQKMGVLYPRDKLEIIDGRHGRSHVAILTPSELLSRIAGTTAKDAIVEYVRGVL